MFKKKLKRIALAACLTFTGVTASYAYDFASVNEGDSIYYNITSSTSLTVSVTYKDDDYNSYSEDIIIPSTVTYDSKTYTVTSIGDSAFYKCTSLDSINLPEWLTSIGEYAFRSCTSLESIDIPDGVTSIGSSAFNRCTSLTSIDLPEDLTSIGGSAFYRCTSLTSIDLPEGLTSLKSYTFYYCKNLESIDLPDGVTSIGSYAFYYCTSLESIDLPEGLTSIGGSAFSHCTSLTSVTFGDELMSIGSYAFSNCTSLESIDLPDGVTSIGSYAFYYCTSLVSIDIPDGVTSIEERTFSHCTSLESIDLPDGVTSIGGYAFYYCTSLESIDLPEGVTSIGEWAFSHCTSLVSIDLPDELTSIDIYAFEYCPSLTDVYSLNETPPSCSSSTVFSNSTYTKAELHVPMSALTSYQTTFPWSKFGTIKELPSEELQDLIEEADTLINDSVNVGDGVLQIPESALEELSDAYNKATKYDEDDDNDTLVVVIVWLRQAIEDFLNTRLNAPDDNERYTIAINDKDFTGYDGKAMTYYYNDTDERYDLSWLKEPDVNYAQSFRLTEVTDSVNVYYFSFVDANDVTHYLCTGAQVGDDVNEIRTTEDKDDALKVKVIASHGEEGVWQLYNTEANAYIAGEGAEVYSTNEYGVGIAKAEQANVTLNVTSAEWATVILPFKADVPSGLTVYELTGTTGTTDDTTVLSYTEVGSIAANQPYLVNSSEAEYSFSGYGQASADSYSDDYMTGTYVETAAKADTYVLQNQEDYGVAFYIVGEDDADKITIGANRAYISTLPSSASSANIRVALLTGDTTTGIISVSDKGDSVVDENEPVNVYSISGMLMRSNVKASEALDNLPKGVYIVNGKKQLVK